MTLPASTTQHTARTWLFMPIAACVGPRPQKLGSVSMLILHTTPRRFTSTTLISSRLVR